MFATSRFYIRDGALIGDLRDAVRPMIWRMELSRVHAVAFRVAENNGQWDLGIEGGKGDFTPIASYKSQEAADHAFRRLGRGLRAQGWVRRLLTGGMLCVLLLLALFAASGFIPLDNGSQAVQRAVPNIPLGQSVPADQALRVPGR